MTRSSSWSLLGVAAAFAVAGCSEVAEVLHAAAGSGNLSATAGSAGSGGAAGLGGSAPRGGTAVAEAGSAAQPSAGGAQAEDPELGVFVDSGDAHSCAARFGILYCWGANVDGRLGVGDNTDRNAPTRVGLDADWVQVATGVAHTCALKQAGSVWCFGANTVGQLGQGNSAPSNVPVLVPLPSKAVQLSSEANTACAVLDDGALYCWGRNWEGNIGLNDTHPGVDQLSPVRSGEQSDWQQVGTGDGHTCAIRGGGLLFGWGRNTAANLGLGQTNDQQRRSATQIGTDADWLSVVSGQDSSCGIRSAGELFCWGGNSFGNLGLGDQAPRLVPTQVAPGRAWAQLSIDTFHGCGIDVEQNLYCWGRGIEGQLGAGDNAERSSPELIGPGFAQVVVGRMSSCVTTVPSAATATVGVLCTGENAAGQLGLADNVRRNTFTELTFP